MTEKDLKKLRREELLEMLIQQSEHVTELEGQLAQARKELEDRRIALDEAGSIAEAALKLNGIFDAAQASAQQYLDNIKELSAAQEETSARLLEESRREAEQRVEEARRSSEELEMETRQKCVRLEVNTKHRCEEMVASAEQKSKAYWDDVSNRLNEFYEMHAGIREMLSVDLKAQEQK